MLEISRSLITAMHAHATSCLPEEACGLFTGARRGAGGVLSQPPQAEEMTGLDWLISGFHPAANIAATPRTRFEVDPAMRLALQRDCRGTATDVIGVFHSHPNGSVFPSETDLAMALEMDLLWVIMGQAEATDSPDWAAYHLLPAPKRFTRITAITVKA